MTRLTTALLLGSALILATCSSQSTPTGSAGTAAPPLASAAPTRTDVPTADLTNWAAFQEQAESYAKNSAAIGDLSDGFWVVDLGTPEKATQVAKGLQQASTDLLAWLDQHPSQPCYEVSWKLLRAAAGHVLAGTQTFLAPTADFNATYREMGAGGQDLADLTTSMPTSSSNCQGR